MTTDPQKPTPAGWPRISSAVFYDNASEAIDFLERAFGFRTRLRVDGENGRVEHSELTYGDGLIMIADRSHREDRRWVGTPGQLDGMNTQALCVIVDDVDAHFAHARAQGATVVTEPATKDYGPDYWADRSYEVLDSEGHHWWFMQRVRNPGEPVG